MKKQFIIKITPEHVIMATSYLNQFDGAYTAKQVYQHVGVWVRKVIEAKKVPKWASYSEKDRAVALKFLIDNSKSVVKLDAPLGASSVDQNNKK